MEGKEDVRLASLEGQKKEQEGRCREDCDADGGTWGTFLIDDGFSRVKE